MERREVSNFTLDMFSVGWPLNILQVDCQACIWIQSQVQRSASWGCNFLFINAEMLFKGCDQMKSFGHLVDDKIRSEDDKIRSEDSFGYTKTKRSRRW